MDTKMLLLVVAAVLALVVIVVVVVILSRKSSHTPPSPRVEPPAPQGAEIQGSVFQTVSPAPSTTITIPNIAAITASIASAKTHLFEVSSVRRPTVKFLAYVNAGDGILADETPGFTVAAKSFFALMKGRFCWHDNIRQYSNVFYANDYAIPKTPTVKSRAYETMLKFIRMTPEQYAQKMWDLAITSFFANLVVGDTLILFLLTHGGVNEKGVEFILGGMDENNMTELARKIPKGVNLVLYSAGCDQSRPIKLPIHISVDSRAKRMLYTDANRESTNMLGNIMTLTDTWSGYLSQFEPPLFPISPATRPAFTAIMLNFIASNKLASSLRTVDAFYTAYAESGWHKIRGDDALPGASTVVIDNIVSGKWNMFRPVLGLSSMEMLRAAIPIVCR